MTEDVQARHGKRGRLWVALALLVVLLVAVVVPPLVSIQRYKSRITQLMSQSFGRPVRLSSVELRVLPVPGFVLTDLTVEEDPAYGAEPILHANTVTATIRLLSLWRGRLEIGRVSVDEASLNLVRTPEGRWNLDSLFRTATAHAQSANGAGAKRPKAPLPYLEATNSRINIKRGVEKLPFSLLNTDLSFWQENPGDWRLRVRGEPSRTDQALDLAGSGETGVVRLEASVRQAAELRQMPMHVDMEWREAQLGQLTRLVLGSDPGWRGDLTGELHLDGTPDAARINTRLRATNVHRVEFAPEAPLDFDARCGFVYHYSSRALDNAVCDSPLGDGRVRLAGSLPGGGGPHFSIELDRLPVAAGLDAVRTVRSGFAPGVEAQGAISGKITYVEAAPEAAVAAPNTKSSRTHGPKSRPAVQGPLTGSFTVDGLQLSGGALSKPISAPKFVLEPEAQEQPGETAPAALTATFTLSGGAPNPLTVSVRLAGSGYQLTLRGQAAMARTRELARVAGMANAASLDQLAGDGVAVDLMAEGPWLPMETVLNSPSTSGAETDSLTGTVTFHNANWKADYLANNVDISQATLHVNNGDLRWDPVLFSYGPVKGTASFDLPSDCQAPCVPRFVVQFGALDAAALQAAILGAHEKGTLLSELIARFSPSAAAPVWPQMEGTVQADSLILGPVTLREATATLRVVATGAEITGLDAGLLGGRVHGAGTLRAAGAGQDKPAYTLEGQFEKLDPAAVGQLIGLRCTGGTMDADGKIDLSGFTDQDLTQSVKGTLHFDWRRGAVSGQDAAADVPAALSRFDRWTGDAAIANGKIVLKQSEVQHGSRRRSVDAALTLGETPAMTFPAPAETQAKR